MTFPPVSEMHPDIPYVLFGCKCSLCQRFGGPDNQPRRPKVRVQYRGRPWDWHVFKPLHGDGYRAFWFGPFKIIVRN
jgi:hypothetical protein